MSKFEKVSYKQFANAMFEYLGGDPDYSRESIKEMIKEIYANIKLPKRATKHSAGYDFFAPFSFSLPHGKNIKIPTGIKAQIDDGYVLMEYIRSSIGFKYGVSLVNSTGIIDGDYYNNESNEGQIFIKLSNNDGTIKRGLSINRGEAFCQGIFLPYGITIDDDTDGVRKGGIGSTNI